MGFHQKPKMLSKAINLLKEAVTTNKLCQIDQSGAGASKNKSPYFVKQSTLATKLSETICKVLREELRSRDKSTGNSRDRNQSRYRSPESGRSSRAGLPNRGSGSDTSKVTCYFAKRLVIINPTVLRKSLTIPW